MLKTRIDDKASVLRLLEKYKFVSRDCWRSSASSNIKGYATIGIEGKTYRVHRLSMYVFKDFDLNSDFLICHKIECQYPDCWNPDHLYVGTHENNMSDIIKKNYENPKPFFKCGHKKEQSNIYSYYSNGCRVEICLECKLENDRRNQKLKRERDKVC